MYIGREDEKNILSYLDLTILRNVISQFPKLSINILKDVINFSISYSARAFKWRKKGLTGLQKYVNQINTRRYGDYTTNDNYFCEPSPIQIASDMRLICASLFQSQ